MTNYSSFDVQLRQRKQQNEQSRLISKKLYSLGVKMARDITSTCPSDRTLTVCNASNILTPLGYSRFPPLPPLSRRQHAQGREPKQEQIRQQHSPRTENLPGADGLRHRQCDEHHDQSKFPNRDRQYISAGATTVVRGHVQVLHRHSSNTHTSRLLSAP